MIHSDTFLLILSALVVGVFLVRWLAHRAKRRRAWPSGQCAGHPRIGRTGFPRFARDIGCPCCCRYGFRCEAQRHQHVPDRHEPACWKARSADEAPGPKRLPAKEIGMRPLLTVAIALNLLLTGCSLSRTAAPMPQVGGALQGRVFGGQQPIVGARVYLFAANTTGYGGPGIAPSASNASLSLLGGAGTATDSVGTYVTTDANGNFSITGDYTCTANTQVYVYALGGNPGAGTNSAAGLLAALGSCPAAGNFLASTPFIFVNEVSTIAAAYAMAGFASDATHVSSSSTALAKTGIANAFANAANLAGISTGAALTTTPGGNGTVPQSEINTLANILAACINSTGPVSTACTTLLGDALSSGSTGTTPTDTATAAINLAHYPGTSVAAVYALSTGPPPFSPALAAVPKDFAVALKFTGGGIGSSGPNAIAIDASSNVWVISTAANTVSEFSSNGVALSGSSGYTGGGMQAPEGIAIDLSGNLWAANNSSGISKFSSTGAAISPTPFGYTGGGISGPAAVAVDGAGNVWIGNDTTFQPSASKLSSSGGALSGSSGYMGGGIIDAISVAIDASGNAWFADDYPIAGVSKFSNGGTPSPLTSSNSGGGLAYPGRSRWRSMLREMCGRRVRRLWRSLRIRALRSLHPRGIPAAVSGIPKESRLMAQETFGCRTPARSRSSRRPALPSRPALAIPPLACFQPCTALQLIAPATCGSPREAAKVWMS